MKNKAISFRTQLKRSLSAFLKREDMSCPRTEEALLDLVVALSHYTEEGHSLFPQVVLCDDMDITLSMLQCSDRLKVGDGPRAQATMAQALKRCAPLTRGGWVIYILRQDKKMEFGVFRSPSSPTALDIRGTVLALAQEAENVHIIVASQLAEKAVELVGGSSGVLHVYFSGIPDDAPSPQGALAFLSEACCKDVPDGEKEQVTSFMRSSLSTAVQQCHGTLIGVQTAGGVPGLFEADGVIFEQRKSMAELVREHELQRTDLTLAALNAYANLLIGMVTSDGMVLLDSRAGLVGYNIFIAPSVGNPEPTNVPGGARRRAYSEVCRLVDVGTLRACFIRSSDGASEYYQGRGKL